MQKRSREHLMAEIGTEVVRFQEESSAFDDLAARVLAIEPVDLPCMTLLLYGGPTTIQKLQAALHSRRAAVVATIDRLQLAGYARRRSDGDHTWSNSPSTPANGSSGYGRHCGTKATH